MLQILDIIWKAHAIACRNGFQSTRDRVTVDILGNIGGMNDFCHPQQAGILQVIFEEDRLEGATTLMVAEFYAWCIKGNGSVFLDDSSYLTLWYKEKLSFIIDKAGDDPRTGDPIYMDM